VTHRQKVDYLIEDMRRRGMGASAVAPPVFKLLWAMGFEVPPPLFMGFVPLALFTGGLFGFFWGLIMGLLLLGWLFLSLGGDVGDFVLKGVFGVTVVAGASIIAGILFGLMMAGYMRWKAGKLGLLSWDDYPPNEHGFSDRPLAL
jgi:hypothetical protein